MAHINLLPWREGQRQKSKQQYFVILGLVAAGVLALFWAVGMMVDNAIDNQRYRNTFIQTQISALDSKISQIKQVKDKKNAIEQQMALIEQLQTSRNVAPHVMDELVRLVPDGVSFSSLVRVGNQLQLDGKSESNNRLAEFMRRLQQSKVFDREELSSIVASSAGAKPGAISDFKLTFFISQQVAPQMTTGKEDKK